MHRMMSFVIAAMLGFAASAETVFLETEAFDDWGGWVNDTQFMDQMGSPYLLAHGLGKPVADAKIPILLVYGGADNVLDPRLNSEIFIPRFKAAGGNLKVIYRKSYAHHPHGFEESDPTIVNFFAK